MKKSDEKLRVIIFWLNLGKKVICGVRRNLMLLRGFQLTHMASHKTYLTRYNTVILFWTYEIGKNSKNMEFGGRVTKSVISHLAEGIGTGTKQFWTPEIMLFQMIYENKCCTAGSGGVSDMRWCVLHYKILSSKAHYNWCTSRKSSFQTFLIDT